MLYEVITSLTPAQQWRTDCLITGADYEPSHRRMAIVITSYSIHYTKLYEDDYVGSIFEPGH